MTHSDDDGLVLPPRLAPKHIVISPIYRDDAQKAQVMEYCQSLLRELTKISYDGRPLRVLLDDRDIRGGEKKWQHVRKGIPIRLEIGARDIAQDGAFMARRDQGSSTAITRTEFTANVVKILDEIQGNLFQRALDMRTQNSHRIDSLADFRDFFSRGGNEESAEQGGFVYSHWSESTAMHEVLKELKVTPRCIPLDAEEEPGQCIFTGQPSTKRLVFAKSY